MPVRRRGSERRRRGSVPGFEPLEVRVVLDVAAARGLAAAVTLVGGTLTVDGTDRPDRIAIGVGRRGQTLVRFNGEQALYSGVDRIAVQGNRGADRIRIDPGVRVPTTVDGGIGPDRIVATGSSADVSGGAGNDVLVGGGGGRPTLDGDTGADRVVLDGPLGTLRVAAGAGGEALALLRQGYRLAPLQAGAAGAAAPARFDSAPILVGPTDLDVPTKVAALRAAYSAGETVAVTDATAVQAQQLATLVGHGGTVRFRDGDPVAAMVAFRRVQREGKAVQYETTVTDPSRATDGPAGRAAGRAQLTALTASFASRPAVAAPAATSDPGNLLALANSYVYRAQKVGSNNDFVQNVTTVYGVRSFRNQSDFYYVSQETDLVAVQVRDQTNQAYIYLGFERTPLGTPGLIQAEPADTLASRSVTSGVSYSIGGSFGYNQAQGFNASVTGGVTISNSTTTSYPPINIRNLSDNGAIGIGNPAWSFAVDPASAPGTSGTTVTAIDSYIWAVPFGLYNAGQTQVAFSVEVQYDTIAYGETTDLYFVPVVDIPFGDTFALRPPALAAVDRPTVSPGQVFTIQGAGFYPSLVTDVLVGGTPATFQALSDTEIAVVASNTPGKDLPLVVLTNQGVSNFNVTVNIELPPTPPPPPTPTPPPTPVPATTIAGNLGQTIFASSPTPGLLQAGQFTVAPGAIWSLDSATLLLDPQGNPLNSTVSLYSDNGQNRPGTLITTLGTIQAPASSGYFPRTVTVAPGSSPTLLFGGTTYWLVLSADLTNLSWASTATNTSGSLGSVESIGFVFSPDGTPFYVSSYAYQFGVRGRRIAGT